MVIVEMAVVNNLLEGNLECGAVTPLSFFGLLLAKFIPLGYNFTLRQRVLPRAISAKEGTGAKIAD